MTQRRRILALLAALCAALMLLVWTASTQRDVDPPSWPYDSREAPEVSLGFAWARLTGLEAGTQDPGPGWLRAADAIATPSADELALLAALPEGQPLRAGVLDRHLHLDFGNGARVRAHLPFPSSGVVQDLLRHAQADIVVYENANFEATLSDRLFQILPIVVLIGLLVLLMGRGATKSLGLTSAFVVVPPESLTESFADVAGIDKARGDLDDIVAFLKDPKAAGRLGGRMPKGVLFAGPPGTGKTLLARALAKEAGVAFLAIEASGVNQIFVGAGAMKIRRAFREARKRAPCIVFVDEIDALGRARGGQGGGNSSSDEKDTTLNALLVELDGLESRAGVVLIAATNRPDVLDPALVRRGRIDRRVDVALPSVDDRAAILRVHMGRITTDIALADAVARETFGLAGADLAALVNEAALAATRRGAQTVAFRDYRLARDRLLVGVGSSDIRLSESERRLVSVHEAGHALVAALTPHADAIERVTIVPQGTALGFVMQRPEEDRRLSTRAQLEARMDVALAGRAAETIVLGQGFETNGAESDVALATRIAAAMAGLWGMGSSGFVRIEPGSPLAGDGQDIARDARAIVNASQKRVMALVEAHKGAVEALAAHLVENETMEGSEAMDLLQRFGALRSGAGLQAPDRGIPPMEASA